MLGRGGLIFFSALLATMPLVRSSSLSVSLLFIPAPLHRNINKYENPAKWMISPLLSTVAAVSCTVSGLK